ncbi:MAG: CHAT domain-containing protein [Xenococcaceae cyanobacterium]
MRIESGTASTVNTGDNYWQKGEVHRAINAWAKEARKYGLQKQYEKEAEIILKISQGYINLSQFDLAIFQLEKLLESFREKENLVERSKLIALTWEKLGNAYSRSGDFSQSILAYQKSLDLEEKSLSALNNLVILLKKQSLQAKLQADSARNGEETFLYRQKAQSYQTEAIEYASQALNYSQSQDSLSSVRALIEWGKLSSKGLTDEQLKRGRKLLDDLLPSRTKVFLVINWAKLDDRREKYWLFEAKKIAKKIGDATAESYALLELGYLSKEAGDLEKALSYAEEAQFLAQLQLVYDNLYRSHWLAAKIYLIMGKSKAAIFSYQKAIAALDSLNQGIINISVEQRINFKSEIEPIYRELLELLLSKPNLSQSNLSEALFVFDKLRLAQLQNYFGDNCFEIEERNSTIEDVLIAQNAVSLNSIILDEQTHFILQLPDGTLRHHQVQIKKTEINKLATDWSGNIRKFRETQWNFFSGGEFLYDLMVRPFEAEIAKFNPSTLIFIHDGVLRNLPMAALFDGEKFLAQKWASVSSIGLNFRATDENKNRLTALAFGLGVARKEWSKLEDVEEEVDKVVDTLGGKKLLNANFTSERLSKELKLREYSVLHFATHGYFGGVAENSFILAYDRALSAKDLENSLSQSKIPLDLLVFSACETAVSNDFSTLGLAGIALRNGVNSVLGSFWQVQDEVQLELMQAFYSRLKDSNWQLAISLRAVQLEQIELGGHPYEWAALTLIKNF